MCISQALDRFRKAFFHAVSGAVPAPGRAQPGLRKWGRGKLDLALLAAVLVHGIHQRRDMLGWGEL
ncbi:MAG: hypothetical protein AMXMBFR31_04120 [Candidatus Desulfobacillus denitrificans]|uniref:Transposase n=1 Tax=Candidatus Desulfobacillus denitrificans TaxID=2608985 RepID=A0A809QXQ7_9PROT|nr:hypothetical protein DSYM_00270 [Candidatus Desulfobacillus denitrificans]GIK45491.1 MAG: hypothetical protein BroJett012_13940 [Betaproteobacteria bacterium]GJQ54379.1 MAG: hypothetical protein HKUEN07_09480 [Rhodocyclaceae bacterium]